MELDQDFGANSLEPLTNNDLNSLLSKTLEGYSQQKPTMVWNTTKKTWDTWQGETLFEQWEPFLGTWPTSGMMHDGKVYELAMPVQHTNASESSSSPTLPTPVVNDMGAGKTVDQWDEWTAKTKEKHQNGNGHGPSLNIEMLRLLPTPLVDDSKNTGHSKKRIKSLASETYDLGNNPLLPTVTTQDGKNNGGPSQFDRNTLPLNTQVLDETSWGKFEPAIRRWESVLGRPAPAPTKPDGKDGAHRLSSKFTEWMMGLPDGWITNCGLTRNQELKACGNGVVPQQAELALRILLGIK